MPSWLKKHYQVLKRDLISHLVIARTEKQALTTAIYDNNNEKITNNVKSPIQKIRNDLRVNRFRSKTDMNAYRDYAKWRDQVLISQNNCALRCIKEEKINNIDKVDSLECGATSQTDSTAKLENRSNHCDDKTASSDATIDDASCHGESESMTRGGIPH